VDLTGKALGVPVHQLLGGHVRDRIRVYSWIGGDSPAQVAEQATAKVAQGFTAVKMNGSAALRPIDTAAEAAGVADRVAAVREVLGPDRDVAVDFHGRFSLAMAGRTLPLLESSMPLFVEEPTVPEASELLGRLIAATPIPIALGERLYNRWDFRRVLGLGVAVVQPDVAQRRRDLRGPQDRHHGRGVRRQPRSALPARTDRPRRQPAGRPSCTDHGRW